MQNVMLRLDRLAERRVQEGNYTDANICRAAGQAIAELLDLLASADNQILIECKGAISPATREVLDSMRTAQRKWSPDERMRPEHEANANLIAAAPELLEAVKRAEMWLGKMIADGGHLNAVMPNDCIRTAQMVRAAIAKAEGGAP